MVENSLRDASMTMNDRIRAGILLVVLLVVVEGVVDVDDLLGAIFASG